MSVVTRNYCHDNRIVLDAQLKRESGKPQSRRITDSQNSKRSLGKRGRKQSPIVVVAHKMRTRGQTRVVDKPSQSTPSKVKTPAKQKTKKREAKKTPVLPEIEVRVTR